MTAQLDYSGFDALTFDCYGTLIDWEAGILAALRPTLAARGIDPPGDELLEAFGRAEATAESGRYLPYRDVLASCLREICSGYGVEPSDEESRLFGGSVVDWPAFPDSGAALRQLRTRFRLGVITNCDDDLFSASNARLGVGFDWVVTAEAVGSYKPDPRNFEAAFAQMGVERARILHIAQSLFHDHVPAKRLGLSTVWIDRRQGRPGVGATPPAAATPDATYRDMATFAGAATRGRPAAQ
jgi:2-haloacid dehalogenase